MPAEPQAAAPTPATPPLPRQSPSLTPLTVPATPTAPSATPTPAISANANPDVSKFVFTVSLDDLDDVDQLHDKQAITEALEMATRHPHAPIYIAAYVTDSDSRSRHADAKSVSDELVLQTARFLTGHGIDPNRIVGKGEGINPMIGRAVVISFDLSGEPEQKPRKPHEFAARTGADVSA